MSPLSPDAQKIKDSIRKLYGDERAFNLGWPDEAKTAAATLLAAVDQVVPESFGPPENAAAAQREITRADFLAIVAELRGTTTPAES